MSDEEYLKAARELAQIPPQLLRRAKNPRLPKQPEHVRLIFEKYEESLLALKARIYLKYFTFDEMQKILAFFRSDLGMKFLGQHESINTEFHSAGKKVELTPEHEAYLQRRMDWLVATKSNKPQE